MAKAELVRWFDSIRLSDVPLVGGKNASLGELHSSLSSHGIKVPNGFVLTAHAYREALTQADAWMPLRRLLGGLDKNDLAALARCAREAREIVYAATDADWLRGEVLQAYSRLEVEYGSNIAVVVRSSATAEDLPTASFAGQHESFLNVCGAQAVFEACRRCFASLFTERAISYRIDQGFDHFKVALSVGVMKMVRSDIATSGVMFTLDTETGFPDVVFVTAAYGLGENVVQGTVDPDEFYVHKPTFQKGYRAIIRRNLGQKARRLILRRGRNANTTRNIATHRGERMRFCVDDADVMTLTEHALQIEAHYSKLAGRPTPMDIEWAKDGIDNQIYIVQARPETVASQKDKGVIEIFSLEKPGKLLASGHAVGERIATGRCRLINGAADLAAVEEGEVLVSRGTSPDWEPIMKKAAAIVTDHGGRTCHAAIVARELGLPAVVGTENATQILVSGQSVTVSCAEGEVGAIYEGEVACHVTRISTRDLKRPRVSVMVNLGDPGLAFRTALLPNDGVGLARLEFIINDHIGIHPMAAVAPERLRSAVVRRHIARLTTGYSSASAFFVERLSEGVGTIAAAFYPKPVIVRLSDFKTNEYAHLLGGSEFEPREANPMLGFRGAARYTHPAYAAGFALECAALQRVRETMGLDNLRVMVPFCRRVEEAKRVLRSLGENGLKRHANGLQVYVMCEIPNNIIEIDEFARYFDGFSIGSNDLTQLILGVDRDSDIVAFDFDERDPGMLTAFRQAIEGAHRNHRHIGICGEAPAVYPKIARYLIGLGIDSLSVNPDSLFKTMATAFAAEHRSKVAV